MSMSYTTTDIETFTIMHARRIASKVATDSAALPALLFQPDRRLD